MYRCLMVVDQPIEADKRVLSCIDSYKKKGMKVQILESFKFLNNEPTNLGGHFSVFFSVIVMLLHWLIDAISISLRFFRFYKSRKVYRYNLKFCWFGKTFWIETIYFMYKGMLYAALNKDKFIDYNIIHVHDLKSLSFSYGIRKLNPDLILIYDAHELSAFRNRKNISKLSALLTTAFERLLSSEAKIIISVSPACLSYIRLFSRSKFAKYRLVCNNFYSSAAPVYLSKKVKRYAIVYIGSLNSGRGLDRLSEVSSRISKLDVFVFCPEDNQSQRSIYKKYIDKCNFRFEFGEYDKKVRLILKDYCVVFGWYCLEDICLSYNFSLSGKLFQYMAYEFPIVYCSGICSSKFLDKLPMAVELSKFQGDIFWNNLDKWQSRLELNSQLSRLVESNYDVMLEAICAAP